VSTRASSASVELSREVSSVASADLRRYTSRGAQGWRLSSRATKKGLALRWELVVRVLHPQRSWGRGNAVSIDMDGLVAAACARQLAFAGRPGFRSHTEAKCSIAGRVQTGPEPSRTNGAGKALWPVAS
jgi:hypothetical protein